MLDAAGNSNSGRHDDGLDIVRGADDGELPVLWVPDVVLVETMNGLSTDVGHRTAVGMLDRLEAGSQFDAVREPGAVWAAGIDIFHRYERLSLADAVIVATLRHHDID